jgi:hypothetical protein
MTLVTIRISSPPSKQTRVYHLIIFVIFNFSWRSVESRSQGCTSTYAWPVIREHRIWGMLNCLYVGTILLWIHVGVVARGPVPFMLVRLALYHAWFGPYVWIFHHFGCFSHCVVGYSISITVIYQYSKGKCQFSHQVVKTIVSVLGCWRSISKNLDTVLTPTSSVPAERGSKGKLVVVTIITGKTLPIFCI